MFPTETEFESQVLLQTEAVPVPEDPPFHILFLGDYSGRENLSQITESPLAEQRIFEINRDNFEDVMKKLNVSLRLRLQEAEEETLVLGFRELDDFHPDRIFRQVPLFSELRDIRKRLSNHESFETAAIEVRSWFEENSEKTIKTEKDVAQKILQEKPVSSGNLLDDILTDTKVESDSYNILNGESNDLSGFIRKIVKPHIIQTDENEQKKLVAVVDEAIGELMRRILHHPQFQALESAWRGLYFVVRRTETNQDLKLFLLDIAKQELARNLKSVNDLSDSQFYRKIVSDKSQTIGGEPWALLCGNYEFELNVEDAAALIRLAKIGNTLTAPFISQIKPQMLGIDSLVDNASVGDWNLSDETVEGKLWTALRTIPEAANLGFILPRFLTRLPYGEATEPTEVFSFEEFTESSEHTEYVWANSSFICALLLAQTFSAYSWEFQGKFFDTADNFPTHLYKDDNDEIKTKSCAEINMTHDACDKLIEQGLMPLISFRDSDSVKIADLQSIAFPSKQLNGRWS